MRVPFTTLFTTHPNNSIEPVIRIRVGGVTIGPGTTITRGVYIGGIDLALYIGHDFEVDVENNVYVIKGIY